MFHKGIIMLILGQSLQFIIISDGSSFFLEGDGLNCNALPAASKIKRV
jgi:hypothetical protein